jgi:SAM-dependent methyltransferase
VAQAPVSSIWQAEVDQIYSRYAIYAQADGAEQPVFDSVTGTLTARSDRIVEFLISHVSLPVQGRLLDIGCGNGAFLRAFGRWVPEWRVSGTEINDKYKQLVESIPNLDGLYIGTLPPPASRYNLVSLIHALEHIPNPRLLLQQIWDRLDGDGLLLVQVPDYLSNPFELVIADHCTHFSLETAMHLLRAEGFEVLCATDQFIPKEISIIAKKGERGCHRLNGILTLSTGTQLLDRVCWLMRIVESARNWQRGFGIFGTSIAGSWLYGQCPQYVGFFVDEDASRTGRKHLGQWIYRPDQVPKNIAVLLPLAPQVGRQIVERLSNLNLKWILPPDGYNL